MGSVYLLSLLVLLLVTSIGQICGSEVENETLRRSVEGNKPSERVFETELEGLIRRILENGLPDLNIPPLDPFLYEPGITLNEIDMSGMMTIEYLELGDLGVVGLSKFVTNSFVFNLNQLAITVNLTFPLVVDASHSNFSIVVGDLIPFYGGGTANLNAALRIEAFIGLGRTPYGVIYLDALSADIFFDCLEVEFSTLMGVTGGKETYLFNKVIGSSTPELINMMKPYMIDDIVKSVLTSANEFILPLNITYVDIISCLTGIGASCPFDLP